MSKLVLHIGMHKTASTSIQDTFANNRAYLNSHGLVFPKLGQGHHGLVTDWIKLPDHFTLTAPAENHWRHIAKTQGSTGNTVFLSTEELSRGGIGSRVDFTAIKNWTGVQTLQNRKLMSLLAFWAIARVSMNPYNNAMSTTILVLLSLMNGRNRNPPPTKL